jgi:hypothetical protein
MSNELKRLLSKKRKRLLSTGAIAERSGYTPGRIWQLWKAGKLPAELANPAEVSAGKQARFLPTRRIARWCRKRRERKELRRNRKPLKGDRREKPAPHYLTFINNFDKWDRHVKIGKADMPSTAQLRFDFERVLGRIIELCGVDWAASLLEKCRVAAKRKESLPQTRRDKNYAPWQPKRSLPDLWSP